MKEMTKVQSKVYRYINAYFAKQGYAPTRREIADRFSWSSCTAADHVLRALQRKKKIVLDKRAHRNIVVL